MCIATACAASLSDRQLVVSWHMCTWQDFSNTDYMAYRDDLDNETASSTVTHCSVLCWQAICVCSVLLRMSLCTPATCLLPGRRQRVVLASARRGVVLHSSSELLSELVQRVVAHVKYNHCLLPAAWRLQRC